MRTFTVLLLTAVGVFFCVRCIEAGVVPSYVIPYDPYVIKYPPGRDGKGVSATKPPETADDSPDGSWKPQPGGGYGSWRPQPGGAYGNWRPTTFGGYGSWRPPPVGSYGSWKPQSYGGYGSWRPQPGGGYGSWGSPPGGGFGLWKPPPGTADGTYKHQSSEEDEEHSDHGNDDSDESEDDGPGGSADRKVGKVNSRGGGGRGAGTGRLNGGAAGVGGSNIGAAVEGNTQKTGSGKSGGIGGQRVVGGTDNQEGGGESGVVGSGKIADQVRPEAGSNKVEGEARFGGSRAKHIRGHIDSEIDSGIKTVPLEGGNGGVSEVTGARPVGEAGAEGLSTGGSGDAEDTTNVAKEEIGGATTDSNAREEETSTTPEGDEYFRSQLRFGGPVSEESHEDAGVASKGRVEAEAIPESVGVQEAVEVEAEQSAGGESANQVVDGSESNGTEDETGGENAEAGITESQKAAEVEVNEGEISFGGSETNVHGEVEAVGQAGFVVASNIAGGEFGAGVLGTEGSEIQQATESVGNIGVGIELSAAGAGGSEVNAVASSNEVEGQTGTGGFALDGGVDIVRSSRSLQGSGGQLGGSSGGAGGSGGQLGMGGGSSGEAVGRDGQGGEGGSNNGRPGTAGKAGTAGTVVPF